MLSFNLSFSFTQVFAHLSLSLPLSPSFSFYCVLSNFFSIYFFFSLFLCASKCVLWSECNSRIERACELWNISNKWACPQQCRILRNLYCSSTEVLKTSIEGAESTMHVQQMFYKVLKFPRFFYIPFSLWLEQVILS